MNPLSGDRTKEAYQDDPRFERGSEVGKQAKRLKVLPWLLGAICMFAVLYCTSYTALFSLPPYARSDMRSQLVADYSAWPFVVFQPVDPAILEEIEQEQGLPDKIVLDGSFWPTAANSNMVSPIVGTQQPDITSTPTATFIPVPEGVPSTTTPFQPTYTLTPKPTSIGSSSQPALTLQPTTGVSPGKTRKPPRTPKPHKTPKH
jgi:hypothetical protein